MEPEKLMKVIGDAEDEYILSAMTSRKNQTGKQCRSRKVMQALKK